MAIYLKGAKRASNWVLQLGAGVFPNHPSMALFWDSLSLLWGIGTPPALTALVIHAIFPHPCKIPLQVYKGLDPSLEEAGIAFWDDQVGATQEV